MKYSVIIEQDEDGIYVGRVPELKGCVTQGDTIDELMKNMKEAYKPGIYSKQELDEKINIKDEDAWAMTRRLAKEEGILAGMSAGAAMYVAIEKAKEINNGLIVVMLCDTGERYLSTQLFE